MADSDQQRALNTSRLIIIWILEASDNIKVSQSTIFFFYIYIFFILFFFKYFYLLIYLFLVFVLIVHIWDQSSVMQAHISDI